MCGTESNLSAFGLIKNLKDEVKKGKAECQDQVTNLCKRIFKAMEVHTDTLSVNRGLDDLAVQFADMEAKLLNITKERDNLINTVHDLKAENKKLSAKISPTVQHGMNQSRIHKRTGFPKKRKDFIQNID